MTFAFLLRNEGALESSVDPMDSINFFIPILPVPKGRPRMGRGGIVYTPQKTKDFERLLKQKLQLQYDNPPLVGPIVVEIEVTMPRPKSCKRKFPSVRPDIDNLLKSALDAANGVLFVDDGQIVKLIGTKAYGEPGIRINVIPIE